MKKVYLVPSRGAHPNDLWYPWVKSTLEQAGYVMNIPQMPNPDRPQKAAWLSALESRISEVDENTYFIGHSVGCQAILRFLDRLPLDHQSGGVVLVAGWVRFPNWEGRSKEQKAILEDWLNPTLDLSKVADRSKCFTAIFSDNDEFVPKENWAVCENELHAKVMIKHAAGHFEKRDLLEFPEVIDAIREMSEQE
jgi:uncharacterized protein